MTAAREQLDDILRPWVPHTRLAATIDAILDSGAVVPADTHKAAVQREVDWANHLADQLETVRRELAAISTQVDRGRADRADAAIRRCYEAMTTTKSPLVRAFARDVIDILTGVTTGAAT